MKIINQQQVRKMLGINGKMATQKRVIQLIEQGLLPPPTRMANQNVWLQSDIEQAIMALIKTK